jgi:hypothetical protein
VTQNLFAVVSPAVNVTVESRRFVHTLIIQIASLKYSPWQCDRQIPCSHVWLFHVVYYPFV